MTQLLLISNDIVDTRMAGPGVRYWEMARALSSKLDVALATPGSSRPGDGFATHTYVHRQWDTIEPTVLAADVLLFDGNLLAEFSQLATSGKPLILEATYPYSFETLHQFSDHPRQQQMANFHAKLEITRQVGTAGDFFFCANERQRDYWLGVLDALGRINPDTYGTDGTLYQLIDTVPFGLPSRAPSYAGPVMKGVIPGISQSDRVILWGGGLWQWLDPLSLVRAVAQLAGEYPDLRLVFPATRHPNPLIAEMPMLKQTLDLSDQLGLTGKVTFFGDWVPYDLWPSYLLEADIGASMHFDTLETHYAFRTRMLDYIWAGLPMVVTGGDTTSELVRSYDLGAVVPPGDEGAIATALSRLLSTPDLRQDYSQSFEKVRPRFTWETVCEPIARFCEHPHFAADRGPDIGALAAAESSRGAFAPQNPSGRDRQQAEIERLTALVNGYEQGRFIRLMQRLSRWRSK
jgi:glycosyltransferase involved in cell wall biosynthesis